MSSHDTLVDQFKELNNDELRSIVFAATCYIDDFENTIKREEKRSGNRLLAAREQHSKLVTLVYAKLIPDSLSGNLVLMNGSVLKKV